MSSKASTKPAKKAGDITIFGIYSREALKHPWLLTWLVIGTILMEAADLTSPLYLKNFFNTLVLNHSDPTVVRGLIITLVIIALLSLLDWVATRIQTYAVMYLEINSMNNLYATSFEYLINHSYNFFSNQFSGTLTRRGEQVRGCF